MSNETTAAEGITPAPPSEVLPEAAVAFANEFNRWLVSLPLKDFAEVAPILQTLKAAHIPEVPDVSRPS